MSFGKCLVSRGPFTISYIMVLPIPKDNFYKVMLGNLLRDAGSSTQCSMTYDPSMYIQLYKYIMYYISPYIYIYTQYMYEGKRESILISNLERQHRVAGGRDVLEEETYVYLWLIYIVVWQKPARYLKQLSSK